MMDKFVELTSLRHGTKVIVNINRVVTVLPSPAGAEIVFDSDERPLAVKESYEALKRLLVI